MARQFKVPKAVSHYRLGDLLGSGGVGAVYRATDRRDGTPVAVKLIHPHFTTDDSFPDRFEREACAATVLRSPYTVHLFSCGEAEGWYFLVMEYVEGRTLRQALADGPLPPMKALNVAAKVARALSEAEWKEIAHRDLKPDNVLLGESDSVKVYDFGVAKLVGGAGFTFTVGNLPYAAPETSQGAADNRSDIYSVGAILYHMLAGRPPFSGEVGEILRQHHHSPVPLEPLAHLPPSVLELLTRCLEKDPARRHQSASEIAGALERIGAEVERAIPKTVEPPPAPVEEPSPGPLEEEPVPPEPTPTQQPEPAITDALTAELSPGEDVTEIYEAALPEPALPEQSEVTEAFREETELTEAAPPQQPVATALDVPGATRVAQPEPTRVGSSGTQVAPPLRAITLDLSEPKSARPFGGSLGWASYELSLQNAGDEFVELALSAWDSGGRCSFRLPGSVTVPPRASAVVEVRVRPQVRRRGGRREPRNFTVSAAGAGGPPRVVEGQYEDRPYGWLFIAGGLALAGSTAAVAAALAVLFLSTSSGDTNDSTASGENVTADQLAIMEVPLSEVGEEFTNFVVDEIRSGPLSNQRLSEIVGGSAAELEKDGRRDGYKLAYQRADAQDGVIIVSTSVDLFTDRDSADRYLQGQEDEYLLAQGRELSRDASTVTILVSSEPFAVSGLSNGAVGLSALVELRDLSDPPNVLLSQYQTLVGFINGRLLGTASYVSTGELTVTERERLVVLARQLETRMRAVLSGEVDETPVPLTTPEPTP